MMGKVAYVNMCLPLWKAAPMYASVMYTQKLVGCAASLSSDEILGRTENKSVNVSYGHLRVRRFNLQ